MTLNLNVAPYFDDYDINKGYLKILFKPGNSVQARELTQLQSLLQDQVTNLSDHFFKEGSMVIPGQIALDIKANYVKVDLSGDLLSGASFVGKVVQGDKTGVRALVVHYADAIDLNNDSVIDDTNDEPNTLYLKYIEGASESTATVDVSGDGTSNPIQNSSPGTTEFMVNGEIVTIPSGQTTTFVEGETLFVTTGEENLQAVVKTNSQITKPIGFGSIAYIEEGVYYIQGKMIRVDTQKIILNKYESDPTFKVGLEIEESVVSFNDDTSLLDNALGTINQNSPGADRLKISLKLTKREANSIDTKNFIELLVVEEGIVTHLIESAEYDTIMETLARRTHDESGSYTVRPFGLDIRHWFQENKNNGVFSMSDLTFNTEVAAKNYALRNFPNDLGMVVNGEGQAHIITGVDRELYPEQMLDDTGTKYYPGLTHSNLVDAARDKLAIGLETGKAYVRGYEVERRPASKANKYVMYERSRLTYQENNEYIPVDLGTFIYVSDVKGLPDIDSNVYLVNQHVGSAVGSTFVAASTTVGNAPIDITFDHTASEAFPASGTNQYGIDVIANAKVKSVEFYDGTKTNTTNQSDFSPPASPLPSAIYKVYLYDIVYEDNPRLSGNQKYDISSARSIVSEDVYPNTFNFAANILMKIELTDLAGEFTTKGLIFDKYNKGIRGINYPSTKIGKSLLVKPLNAGNTEVAGTDGLVKDTFVFNEVINEAVFSTSGDFPIAGGPALTNETSARVFSKTILQNSNQESGSLINLGHNWVQTVRSVDPISGNTTVDTQYMVLRKLAGNIVDNSGVSEVTLTITGDEAFVDDDDLYYVYSNATGEGVAGSVIHVQHNSNRDNVTLTIDASSGLGSSVDVIVPVQKREVREKQKTIRRGEIELPYTLLGLTGGIVTPSPYDNADASTTGRSDAVAYQNDIPFLRKTANNTLPKTFDVGDSVTGTKQVSTSKFLLKKADISKLSKVYDTCSVTNNAYRIDLSGATKKNLHEMSVEDFEFAQKAYDFFEQTGRSPFNVNLTPSSGTLAGVVSQLTVNDIVNPFKADIELLWQNGVTSITRPTEQPVKINDLTERFTLFDGQKNSIIQLGKINLKPSSLPCSGRPVIIYDYWEHSGSGGYASVDSYPNYDDIPFFDEKRLSDFLDFRPVAEYQSLPGLPLGRGVVTTPTEYPINGSSISADLRAYLGRKDKLYIDIGGNVRLQYGAAADITQFPEDPDDGMVLYLLETDPYTQGPPNVHVTMLDNKRYTMRDIGALDKRITNLEYYTSLNLLEKDTLDLQVTDENGNNRFKNGFIVDQFKDHRMGAVSDPDYRVAIDPRQSELRPFFSEKNVNMEVNPIFSSGYAIKDQKIMLPYTSEYLIRQEKSSKTMNVNPFAIFSFRGSLAIFPSSDDWRETNQLPDIVTDNRGDFDNLVLGGILPDDGVMGTEWDSWQTNWSGTVNLGTTSTSRTTGTRQTGTTTTSTITTRTRTTGERSRSGIETLVRPRDRVQNLGSTVVSTEVIPYIRSKEVYFSADGMKPSTRLYAYFDGQGVSSNCKKTARMITTNTPTITSSFMAKVRTNVRDNLGTSVIFGSNSGFFVLLYDVNFKNTNSLELEMNNFGYTGNLFVHSSPRTIYSSGFEENEPLLIRWNDPESDLGYSERNIGTYSSSNVTPSSLNLTTDPTGRIRGIFDIPNNDDIKFRTGERIFRLTDQVNNLQDSDTNAEATYSASGVFESVQDQILLTRVPEFSQDGVFESEAFSFTGSRTSTNVTTRAAIPEDDSNDNDGWSDPLAQSIMIDLKGGAFITAVELFFSTKDEYLPVTCQLRETVNGYPGPKILGTSIVYPDRVQVSDDGVLPTQFEFSSPIAVQNSKEYCIVILANTQGYRVHVARLGEEALDGSGIISKQPYAGVFFKSQNASTWTADQMEDLKFRISRAKFNTNSNSTIYLQNTEWDDNNNDLWSVNFRQNSMKLYAGSSLVTFFVSDSSGCVPSSLWPSDGYNYVTIKNIFGQYDVFPSSAFNGSHKVVNTTYNSFTIDMRNQFYPLGINNTTIPHTGSSLPTIDNLYTPKSNTVHLPSFKSNFKYDLMKPLIQTIQLPRTSISYEYRGLSGTSQDSSLHRPGTNDSSYVGFTANSNIEFNKPKMIATRFNERLSNVSSSDLDRKSLVYRIKMQSDLDNLSPIIDTHRLSTALISNKVNSPKDVLENAVGYVNTGFIPETESSGGSAATKYITREVVLDQTSSSLRILASVNRRNGCDVDFYYRLKTTNDDIFTELPWTLLERSIEYTPASATYDDFKEYDFDKRGLPEFSSVAVKIVLKTTNSSVVPRVKDLRIIALAS
jgi:hypothetical protein